jgi:hypothetical protein
MAENEKKPFTYMKLRTGEVEPVLEVNVQKKLIEGCAVVSLEDYLEYRKSAKLKKAADKEEKTADADADADNKGDEDKDVEEGEFILREAVEKCGAHAALEEIVEANGIDVDLEGLSVKEKKKAILAALDE